MAAHQWQFQSRACLTINEALALTFAAVLTSICVLLHSPERKSEGDFKTTLRGTIGSFVMLYIDIHSVDGVRPQNWPKLSLLEIVHRAFDYIADAAGLEIVCQDCSRGRVGQRGQCRSRTDDAPYKIG